MSAIVITGILLFLAVVASIGDWRRGLFFAVPVALLQDPLRKLTPGEPVIYVLLVGVVFGVAALTATMSGISMAPQRIWGWHRRLAAPFGVFIAVVIFQAANALTRFGNVFVPLIGLLVYLTPFVALCVVYQMVVRSHEKFLIKFLRYYVVCISLALTTLYLQYLGYDWSILGEVGEGLIIFDRNTGAILTAYSGLFRSSDVAAWHAATCVCFFVICMVNRPMTLEKWLAATVFVLAIIGLGMLTGRRKFLVEIIIFASAYTALLLHFGRGGKIAVIAGLVGLMGFLGFTLWVPDGASEQANRDFLANRDAYFATEYQSYVDRTKSVFEDIPDRVTELGVAPIGWAYNQYGLLGAGLGVGTQGAKNVGAAVQGAAEGGLGRIWLELGAAGFLAIAWLGWAFTRHIWAVLKFVNAHSKPLSRISCGLVSFLLANIGAYAVASQVYSDIFVLLILGTVLGALLAMPVIVERAILQKRLLGLTPNSGAFVLTQRPKTAAYI